MIRGKQFFHGGSERPVAGGVLHPGTKVGISHWGEMSDNGHMGGQHVSDAVYSSTTEHIAWDFAHTASSHHANETGYRGRPVVHEVQPSSDVHPGVHKGLDEYRSSSAQILRTHLAPPGGQPAFHGENWNRHISPEAGWRLDEERNYDMPKTAAQHRARRDREEAHGAEMAEQANNAIHEANTPLPGMPAWKSSQQFHGFHSWGSLSG